MPRKNGWKREHHYANLENAEDNLDANGQVKIGIWSHEEDGIVEHIYEPGAEEGEFIVRQSDENRNFDEEGRYLTRMAGNRANKELMEKYPPWRLTAKHCFHRIRTWGPRRNLIRLTLS